MKRDWAAFMLHLRSLVHVETSFKIDIQERDLEMCIVGIGEYLVIV
jgi:hypothetical protein